MGMDRYAIGRMDGLLLAHAIVHESGIEALDAELKFRGATKVHTAIAKKELIKASEDLKEMCFDMALVICVAAIHDVFGIGEKRMLRFIDKVKEGLDLISDDYAEWGDITREISNQIGIKMRIRGMEDDLKK